MILISIYMMGHLEWISDLEGSALKSLAAAAAFEVKGQDAEKDEDDPAAMTRAYTSGRGRERATSFRDVSRGKKRSVTVFPNRMTSRMIAQGGG